ncbi:TonB-dependent receptor [Massilia sp. PAMC28688]|uniref:TonB-dependent receptor n=1 Tax=Massilia sp. PAMC28688 TaxID=2861283 RepID=UPI001C63435E|nr:TonB-dependent receptor [Massilia sp. PAMC28688]QYF94244.1 TonB-dependent receptor [Massilia sp. PAMC28688]
MDNKALGHSVVRRTAVAIAASLLVASVSYAQQAEGSIYGKAAAGQKITITSVDTNSTRQIVADANGSFTQAKLPPGNYTVTSNGVTREVTVAIGTGTQVILAGSDTPQRVVISRKRNPIDVSSVETTTVFTAEQMRALPVARDVNAIATLAPGVVKGDGDLGNGGLPAFAGASVAENGYYINGFDVTNIRTFLSYANLPFDAIGSQQVKVGGYGAEYGRSLGGVISISTKRGTNTWQGGASLYWSPEALQGRGRNVVDLDPAHNDQVTGEAGYTVYNRFNRDTDLTANVYAGGPIIKDKLFVFGVIEGRRDSWDRFDQTGSTKNLSNQPNGMIKVDFTPNDAHRFEFTGITNKTKREVLDYTLPAGRYATSHVGQGAASTITGGGHTLIAKYTGYLTDNLTLSVLGGKVEDMVTKTVGAREQGQDCPVVYDLGLVPLGCWAFDNFPGSVRDFTRPDDKDTRKAFRVDADYVLGNHTLRAGVDNQEFASLAAGTLTYSGGVYWRYFQANSAGTVNGVVGAVAPNGIYVRRRDGFSTSGEFKVENKAYYLEDTYKGIKNVTLYGGLRWESFDNKNGDGVSFVKADNLFAPRLGAAWDVNGDASMKVYANAGRYYIPVAANTNIRATRGEASSTRFFSFNGKDPRTGAPLNLGSEIGVASIVGDGSLADPATIADTNLQPMSQDEFILGLQKNIAKGWTVGVKGTHRKVNNGMDDYCSHLAFENYAEDKGFTNFDSGTMAGCILVNPGQDVTLNVDLENNGTLKPVTFPASYIGLGQYTRKYDAIEFSADRPFDGKWNLNASYTWSRTKGTAEGYVNSVINQEDAGVSQDFDFPSLDDGADGYTSNDRTHVFKVYGNYMLNDTLRVGMNGTVSSGRPTSCIGFVPHTAADYSDARNYTTASSYYCLNNQGQSVLGQRGTAGRTPWNGTLDMNVAYMPKLAKGRLTLQMDVFNVFDSQQVSEWNETRDYSRATTSATEGKLNPNYQRPTQFQSPRTVRVTARYEF